MVRALRASWRTSRWDCARPGRCASASRPSTRRSRPVRAWLRRCGPGPPGCLQWLSFAVDAGDDPGDDVPSVSVWAHGRAVHGRRCPGCLVRCFGLAERRSGGFVDSGAQGGALVAQRCPPRRRRAPLGCARGTLVQPSEGGGRALPAHEPGGERRGATGRGRRPRRGVLTWARRRRRQVPHGYRDGVPIALEEPPK